MLEVLAAVGVAAAAAVAAGPWPRALVAPAVLTAAALSLAVSLAELLGDGRTSGGLSLAEAGGLVALVFFALRRGPARLGPLAAVLAGVALMAMIPAHTTSSDTVLVNVAGMAVWGLGAVVAAGAARYLDALDERREQSVVQARRDQRLALARDLHDYVAHDVSAIVVQAQAARAVGAREPRHALAALERIEEAGLHALGAMDRAVAALRDAAPALDASPGASPDGAPRRPSPRFEDLRALGDRFAATGTARVQVDLAAGLVDDAPPEAVAAAHRVVTEALTNIRRHAPDATTVSIVADRAQLDDAPALSVTVTDDGGAHGMVSARGLGRRGGFGLTGLRECVAALGGRLEAGPGDNGGWRVSAVVPLRTEFGNGGRE